MKRSQTQTKKGISQVLWIVLVLLVLVGIGVAIRRGLYLTRLVQPIVNPRFGEFDAGIDQQAFLTWLHIIPGSILLILAPAQFTRKVRQRYPRLHRWCGRIYILSGIFITVTALFMGLIIPIGGTNETAATLVFALIFLFELLYAYLKILQREINQHREWMLRAFAIVLAIATVRPIVAIFFAFSNLAPREFFGIAFWLGFTLHLITAEIWINYTRRKTLLTARPQTT